MLRRSPIHRGIAGLIPVVLLIGCGDGYNESDSRLPSPAIAASTTKWYEGGTLHSKSALAWQAASSSDKLATCADFVASAWQNGKLKPSITTLLSTINDVRPLAEELVEFLDATFRVDPDPTKNRRLFENQTVSGIAAIGMVTMGWIK